ncbi:MAG: DUF1002 domain-containing protein [Novibacillus thermophilus]|jgi:uncharacterized protein YpuA (DUF1002 family)|uniref:DUF1002 domain-containing protein n=1 Tax=Novibacillus thermophilus TaxID=1471761 RepID=A0A1U9KBH5_9BACL|nr:DUF1002 domain-containing protein [Novibacillus thermophilus]AQS57398.1 hypothetical protein B0W44_04445 [Novibacillus thermophilus]
MKRVTKLGLLGALFAVFTLLLPPAAFADAVVGETVVTLGADLSSEQRQQLLDEMGVDAESVQVLEVTNEEEHRYLGDYLSAATIGSRAISSAKITLTEEGSGINVDTNNISHISNSIYANAMVTAGVKDADVYVTAPFEVSGTAGLTGILKAFEAAMDEEISEEQKKVANEEMVKTSELGEKYGDEKIAELMMRLKEQLAENKPETREEMRQLVINVAGDLNINLSDSDVDLITDLLTRISELNIDWNQLGKQVDKIRNNLDEILDSPETRNFIERGLDLLRAVIDWLASLFGG